jgi:hypothetical protein
MVKSGIVKLTRREKANMTDAEVDMWAGCGKLVQAAAGALVGERERES